MEGFQTTTVVILAMAVLAASAPTEETVVGEHKVATTEHMPVAGRRPTVTEERPSQAVEESTTPEDAEALLTQRCLKAALNWSPWTTKSENIKSNGCGIRRRARMIRDRELARQCNIPLAEYIEDCDPLTKKEKVVSLQYYFVNDVFGKSGAADRRRRMFDPSIFWQHVEDEKRCPDDITKRKVDFLAMVDKSGGLSRKQFRHLLRSVGFLVKKAIPTISQSSTRMALMTFANAPQIEFHLNTCDNKSCVLDRLHNAEFTGGLTRMATALEEAEHVFDISNGMRDCSRRVILLFTDGTGGRYEAITPELPASHLKVGKGVEIFAIGITELISEEELTQIVSSPSLTHLYYMETVKQTRRIFRRLRVAKDNDSLL